MTIELLGYGIGVVVVWLVAMRLRSVTARQSLYLVASYLFYFSWGSSLIVVPLSQILRIAAFAGRPDFCNSRV